MAYDVNGDGLVDLIAGNAHGYGLAWFEHRIEPDGRRRFIKHMIDDSVAQYHDMVLVDIDCDGELELLTGKRYRAHCGNDPGDNDPVGVYYFKINGGAFEKHVIDYGPAGEASGVGIYFWVGDINGDGVPDIVAPGQRGSASCLKRKGIRGMAMAVESGSDFRRRVHGPGGAPFKLCALADLCEWRQFAGPRRKLAVAVAQRYGVPKVPTTRSCLPIARSTRYSQRQPYRTNHICPTFCGRKSRCLRKPTRFSVETGESSRARKRKRRALYGGLSQAVRSPRWNMQRNWPTLVEGVGRVWRMRLVRITMPPGDWGGGQGVIGTDDPIADKA